MTFNRLFLLSAVCAAIFLLPSCRRTDSPVSTVTPSGQIDKTGANAAFAPLRSTPQTFTVTAGVASKIMGAEGTLLSFYPNSFKDKDGNTITSGSVNIQLIEMYKLGDMIANRTATVTGDGVLKSGGEVSIMATMGGQEVFANKYGLGFKAQGSVAQPMELYYGDANNEDSITTWGIQKLGFGTMVSGTTLVTDTSNSLIEAPYFLFDSCTKFTIINCDHPYDATSEFVTITVVFPDNAFSTSYSTLAIAYPSINVATSLGSYEYKSATHSMLFKGWAPIGPSSKFALMIPKNGSGYYYYEYTGVTVNGMTINANPTLLTKEELKVKLSAL